jgi:hypothetical protein
MLFIGTASDSRITEWPEIGEAADRMLIASWLRVWFHVLKLIQSALGQEGG